MKYLILLMLFASCGKDTHKVCKEVYEYQYNGYTYVEYVKMVCEDVED